MKKPTKWKMSCVSIYKKGESNMKANVDDAIAVTSLLYEFWWDF